MAKTNIKLEVLNPKHAIELKDKHVIDMTEFMMLLIMYDSMVQSAKEHKSNPSALYSVHWVVRDTQIINNANNNNIGGMIGLDNINIKNKTATLLTADIQESKMILEACQFIEDYCINNLKLNLVHGHASREANLAFWEKFGYTTKRASDGIKGLFYFTKIFDKQRS